MGIEDSISELWSKIDNIETLVLGFAPASAIAATDSRDITSKWLAQKSGVRESYFGVRWNEKIGMRSRLNPYVETEEVLLAEKTTEYPARKEKLQPFVDQLKDCGMKLEWEEDR